MQGKGPFESAAMGSLGWRGELRRRVAVRYLEKPFSTFLDVMLWTTLEEANTQNKSIERNSSEMET